MAVLVQWKNTLQQIIGAKLKVEAKVFEQISHIHSVINKHGAQTFNSWQVKAQCFILSNIITAFRLLFLWSYFWYLYCLPLCQAVFPHCLQTNESKSEAPVTPPKRCPLSVSCDFTLAAKWKVGGSWFGSTYNSISTHLNPIGGPGCFDSSAATISPEGRLWQKLLETDRDPGLRGCNVCKPPKNARLRADRDARGGRNQFLLF